MKTIKKQVFLTVAFGTLTLAGILSVGLNFAHATGTLGQCQMTISKTVDKTSVMPGDVVTYTVQFKNTGSANCTGGGVKVTDILDPLLTFISSSETHTSNVTGGYGSDPLYKSSTRTLSWNANTLSPGESGSVVFGATVGSIPSCTTVTIPNKAKIWADQIQAGIFSNTVNPTATSPCAPPPPPPPPPPSGGCIEILKETYNTLGQPKIPVAQFTFKLDNGTVTSQNDASGYARFDNVSVGTHTVTEILPAQNWIQLSVTPSGGAVIVFGGATCSGVVFKNQQTVDPVPPPPPPPPPASSTPPTADIKANGSDGPISTAYNTPVTLSWTSTGANACTVSPNGFTGTNGSQQSSNLTFTQTFTVNCTGPGGSASDNVIVNVDAPLQVTADIKANGSDGPVTVQQNSSANLTWTSTNATSCSVNPNSLSGTSGSQSSGNISNTQTFTLVCYGASWSQAVDTVTVNVNQQNIPPTVNITSNPSVINQGNSSALNWNSQNATSCYASGAWYGSKAISGGETVSPSYTSTYTITCTNNIGQQATAQTSIIVNTVNTQVPTLTLTANPTSITQGQSSVLNWYSGNTSTCTANGGWYGNKNVNGSETVFPSITTTYSMTCNGPGGSVSAQATVFVNVQQTLPTVTLTANPSSITQGQTSVLSWFSNNANSCSASVGWSGSKNLNGSETVSPFTTTTYTITCINNYGIAQASQVVGVVSTPFIAGNNPQITKTVRNVTLNQTIFANGAQGQGLDILEFEIRVRNTDSNTTTLTVRDILPQQLFYVTGSTTVDGIVTADGIAATGLTLSSVAPNQERIVRFRAVIFSGLTQGTIITNQATVVTQSGSTQNGFATITISNRGQILGVADIPTGPENALPFVLVLGLAGSILSHVIIFKKGFNPVSRLAIAGGGVVSLFRNEPVAKKAACELEKRLAVIRAEEVQDDTNGY